MMKIHSLIFNPFQENTYILSDETKECVIIDPGCFEQHEKLELLEFISEKKLKPVKLLNTHCHIDHIFGNKFVSENFNLILETHEKENFNLEQLGQVAQFYGLKEFEPSPAISVFLNEGDVVSFGNSQLDILFVPGHSPGHIAFVNKEQKFVVGGDVLFYGSIGRTDFPGCNHRDLIESIKNKIFLLGDDFQVFCGHGPSTNIGFEKKHNPFLQQ